MTLKRRQFTRKFKLQVLQYARPTARGSILPSCSETTADGSQAVQGIGRRQLRQRSVRELLCQLGMRVARSKEICDQGRGLNRPGRIHRGLLQYPQTTLVPRVPFTCKLRKEAQENRLNHNLSSVHKTGKDHLDRLFQHVLHSEGSLARCPGQGCSTSAISRRGQTGRLNRRRQRVEIKRPTNHDKENIVAIEVTQIIYLVIGLLIGLMIGRLSIVLGIFVRSESNRVDKERQPDEV